MKVWTNREIDWFPNKKEISIGSEIVTYDEIEIHQICAVINGDGEDLCFHMDSWVGARDGYIEVSKDGEYCYIYGIEGDLPKEGT